MIFPLHLGKVLVLAQCILLRNMSLMFLFLGNGELEEEVLTDLPLGFERVYEARKVL